MKVNAVVVFGKYGKSKSPEVSAENCGMSRMKGGYVLKRCSIYLMMSVNAVIVD